MAKDISGVVIRRAGPTARRGAEPEKIVFMEAEKMLVQLTAFTEKQVKVETERGATGFLRGSIAGEVTGRSLSTLKGQVASPAKYALPVEAGRGRGKRMPPWSGQAGAGLRLWVHRKLGVTGRSAIRSTAFLVARAIGRRGIKGRYMFRDALKNNLPRIRGFIKKSGFRIARKLGG